MIFVVSCIFLSIIVIYNFNEGSNYRKNLVIVLGIGYKHDIIKTFFITLKKQSPKSNLLLFSDNNTILFAKEIIKNSLNVIEIELLSYYPYYPSKHCLYPINMSLLNMYIPLYIKKNFVYFFHTIRFFLSLAFLKVYGHLFDTILLCDIKDIMFQNDPFSYYKRNGIYLQEEIYINKNGVGINGINYKWIKPYHPSKAILVNPIINSGQILGNTKEMLHFLLQFCNFMNSTHIQTAEQGSLNFFIYSNKYKGFYNKYKHGYGYTLLLHLPLEKTNDSFTPINNTLYNFDGSIPSIVHGYTLGLKYGSVNRKRMYKKYILHHVKN